MDKAKLNKILVISNRDIDISIEKYLSNEFKKYPGYSMETGEKIYSDITFKNCNFSYLEEDRINFYNITFEECNITRGFRYCSFQYCVFSDSNIYSNSYSYRNRERADLIMKNVTFDKTIFLNTYVNMDFLKVQFFNVKMENIDLRGYHTTCRYDSIRFEGYNNFASHILDINEVFDIEFVHLNGFTKLNGNLQIDKYYKKYPTNFANLKKAASTYYEFEALYKLNRLNSLAGGSFFDAKNCERKIMYKYQKLEWLKSFTAYFICGYGERWYYSLFVSLYVIICNALFFMTGLKVSDEKLIQYKLDLSLEGFKITAEKLSDFWDSLYFSIMTFTTVGYGTTEAVGWISEGLSSIEMIIGVILMAVMTGSLFRKIIR